MAADPTDPTTPPPDQVLAGLAAKSRGASQSDGALQAAYQHSAQPLNAPHPTPPIEPSIDVTTDVPKELTEVEREEREREARRATTAITRLPGQKGAAGNRTPLLPIAIAMIVAGGATWAALVKFASVDRPPVSLAQEGAPAITAVPAIPTAMGRPAETTAASSTAVAHSAPAAPSSAPRAGAAKAAATSGRALPDNKWLEDSRN